VRGICAPILVLLIINAEVVHNHLTCLGFIHDMSLNLILSRCLLHAVPWDLISTYYCHLQKLNWGPYWVPGLHSASSRTARFTHIQSRGRNLYLTSLETRKGRGGGSWGNSPLFDANSLQACVEVYLWKLKKLKYNAANVTNIIGGGPAYPVGSSMCHACPVEGHCTDSLALGLWDSMIPKYGKVLDKIHKGSVQFALNQSRQKRNHKGPTCLLPQWLPSFLDSSHSRTLTCEPHTAELQRTL